MPDTDYAFAIFDLDETLAERDTLIALVAAALRARPWRAAAVALALPVVALRLGVLRRHGAAKQLLLRAALGGLPVGRLERLARAVARDAPLNGQVVAALEAHRAAGAQVWIASAQVAPVVRAFAERFAADGWVGTALEQRDGAVTGRLGGPNHRGAAKVWALDRALPADWRERSIAYSDSEADRPLMDSAARAVWVAGGRPA